MTSSLCDCQDFAYIRRRFSRTLAGTNFINPLHGIAYGYRHIDRYSQISHSDYSTPMAGTKLGGSFTSPIQHLQFVGILLDMDGTIVDSTDAVIKHWQK